MSTIQTPALESASIMDQDVFSQLYQSLTPTMGTPFHEPSSVFDEWLKQDFLSPECSIHSSPEINTPLDQFLMSPPFQSKDDLSLGCSFTDKDLDVSAILDSPAPQLGYPSASNLQMSAPMTNLFADIGESLPAALAALAAVAAAPAVSTTTTSTAEVSPAVQSATTPTFSTKTKKRELEIEDPSDDAAVKRQKNTDAARRSRLRKVQKMETLEIRVSELEKMNAGLLMRVAVLDSEKTNLKAKEQSYENRIKVLEDQLAEAHKALSSRP
ncbi:hypothetical protein EDC94DRAFT_619011 [Helicostylum pulchrum]|uniref:BZIP domain-containing protein n=1 Tax=Helicostylum pulchrum TaxID=562976 RepID=A0ABP9XVB6_9FUNG|nr:hypothetical protein EDC94DRAFT_619011 [Helicostylum pulchrum]